MLVRWIPLCSLALLVALSVTCGGGDSGSNATVAPSAAPSKAASPAPSARAGDSPVTTASVGQTMITLRGKLNGTIVLSAKPACTPGGQAVYMTGAIGSQNISFEIRKTQAGQNYVFPQSGARDPAIVTLVATGTPPTVWTARPSTGKGTVAVSEAGGNIDLDVDFPDGAPQHISGRWSCV